MTLVGNTAIGAERRARRYARADVWLAVAATAAGGCGTVAALAGAAADNLQLAIAGGLAVGTALVLLVAAGWVDGLLAVLLSLPLPALYSTGHTRFTAAAPVTAAVVFAWSLHWGLSGRPFERGALPVRPTAMLLGALVVATIFAQHPGVSARELLNLAVLFAFLAAATDGFVHAPERVERTARILAALCGACGALALLETIGILPGEFPRLGTPFNRAALGFGQPNSLGLFLAVLTPFTVHAYTTARSGTGRLLAAAAVGAATVGLVGTFSRGSWLSLLAGTAAPFLAGDRRFALRIWLVAAVAAVILDVVSGGALRATVQQTIGDWVIEQRAALMLAGVLMFLAHPVIGVGPGGFADELNRIGAQITWLWDYKPTPHNAYVQMAAEAGVIGLAAFLVFLLATAWRLLQAARRARHDPAMTPADVSLRRTLLWSFATACFTGFVAWPLAHGTGQAVLVVIAAGYAVAHGRAGAEAAR
ncbi:MAG TPA: O-antigen ligase family protein [Longimicrobiales bacterium]